MKGWTVKECGEDLVYAMVYLIDVGSSVAIMKDIKAHEGMEIHLRKRLK